MKRLLVLLSLSVLCLACCDRPAQNVTTVNATEYSVLLKADGHVDRNVFVVELEGCEYWYIMGGHRNASLCHKGNCKNPIHQYARPLPEQER